MDTNIPFSATLNCTAKHHKLVLSDQVYDENLNKYQNEINIEKSKGEVSIYEINKGEELSSPFINKTFDIFTNIIYDEILNDLQTIRKVILLGTGANNNKNISLNIILNGNLEEINVSYDLIEETKKIYGKITKGEANSIFKVIDIIDFKNINNINRVNTGNCASVDYVNIRNYMPIWISKGSFVYNDRNINHEILLAGRFKFDKTISNGHYKFITHVNKKYIDDTIDIIAANMVSNKLKSFIIKFNHIFDKATTIIIPNQCIGCKISYYINDTETVLETTSTKNEYTIPIGANSVKLSTSILNTKLISKIQSLKYIWIAIKSNNALYTKGSIYKSLGKGEYIKIKNPYDNVALRGTSLVINTKNNIYCNTDKSMLDKYSNINRTFDSFGVTDQGIDMYSMLKFDDAKNKLLFLVKKKTKYKVTKQRITKYCSIQINKNNINVWFGKLIDGIVSQDFTYHTEHVKCHQPKLGYLHCPMAMNRNITYINIALAVPMYRKKLKKSKYLYTDIIKFKLSLRVNTAVANKPKKWKLIRI